MILVFSLLTGQAFAREGIGAPLSRKKSTIENAPKQVVDFYEKNIQQMKASGLEKKALKLGDKAPEVEVTIGGETMPLSYVYGARPLILKFYRGGWCSYCLTELKDLQEVNDNVEKAGAQILAITPDTDEMIQKTRETNKLTGFDIVSDKGHGIASKFGLVYDVDSNVADQLKKQGIDLAAYQGDDKADLSIPATYVINTKGEVIFSYVDADYRNRATKDELFSAIRSLKKK
ncbi:peroxiredoxin-like family protein [Peredibacter starrii]|uniref:thioredoxin-dependent peroxiredoxin n=1 Tax=Peredibacter starrii TaxID=28202 RepID=A0AAX4HVL2_9BACT|nr:peroxiredoxin-like family protein [Peredibacter starrii]WPU67212.1 peroxiredoxin-like family protein [Peredibacter starrii]